MKTFIIANLKSNETQKEITNWLNQVDKVKTPDLTQIVALPHPYLHLAQSLSSLKLAAQNVSPFPPGSYTGEVNAKQLKDLAVRYSIIGHSERRKYFKETSSRIANKAELLLKQQITPILCLSEQNIVSQLSILPDQVLQNTLFCFEPPSDIGGSETAPLKTIRTNTQKIQSLTPPSTPILYGGSVNAQNISSVLSLDLAGTLVSTAALKPRSFIKILQKLSS